MKNESIPGNGVQRMVARALIAIIAGAACISATAPPAAAVGLVSGLGGPRDYGEGVLAANDDGCTGPIDITAVFGPTGLNFFGTNYAAVHLNNNGNITFTAPLPTFTPFGISRGLTPIIAPFFADVDTRGAQESTGSNLVYYDLDTVNGIFTATWDLVGYYAERTDKRNNFQIRLINQGSGNFDIEFRYQSLQWTTGDLSGGSGGLGGSVARAGYSAGDQINYAELSAAGDQAAMLDLVNQSNVGEPGRFVFAVDNGHPQICGDGLIDGFEECDDHNTTSGDGCSADCQIEACYTCTGEPSVCTPLPDGTSCSDGQFCNGAETCQNGVCQAGMPKGSDGCTTDCPVAPLTCQGAMTSTLVVNDNADDGKDNLVWRWLKGASTTQAEFGDPTVSTNYALCVYAGTPSTLIGKAIVPADAGNWVRLRSAGYKYQDKAGTADGLQKVVLKSSATDKASVVLKGKGVGLPDLSPPITAPLFVQLINGSTGMCWGAVYGESALVKNQTGLLKAKIP